MGDTTKERLLLPKRLNQQHKLEQYSIDACSEDQKRVLLYILQYFKKWCDFATFPILQEKFTPLRMTLCGVAGSGKSTLINTLVTAIRKITGKQTVCMCVALLGLQLSMLGVKHAIACSTFKEEFTILNYQHKP